MSVTDPPTETIDLAREPDFRLGELLIRPSSREAVLNGRSEKMEPRVIQVLIALARRQGEVVSRDQLIDLCWDGRVVSDDAVNRGMTKLRRWAAPATFTLETIPRVGYRLTPADRPTLAPVPEIVVPATPPPRRWPKRRKLYVALASVLALFLVSSAWFGIQFWLDTSRPFYAVLPFDVVGADRDAENLAYVISTTVNQRLTGWGFKVVSPVRSSKYRGPAKAEAAGELDSRYLIDGSIRLDGERLHVAVRVDSTIDQITVWSKNFDEPADQASRLPERISVAIGGLFAPFAQSSLRLPPEVAAGMLRINELRSQGNDKDAYAAAQEFVRAIPTHYTPQIWYASSVVEALDLIPVSERSAALAQARKFAEQADRVTPGSLPTVYYGLTPTLEWAAREKMLRDGLTENAVDAVMTRYILASVLAGGGRIEEANDFAKQAVVLNPVSARNASLQAALLDVAGRREQADAAVARAEQWWPTLESFQRLKFGNTLARGDLAGASALLQDPTIGPVVDPPAERRPYAALVRALATHDASDVAEVERDCADPSKLARDRAPWCLQGLIALNRLDTFFEVALAYFPEQRGATAGEREARWLETPRLGRYTRVLFRSDAKSIRADPRFIPIVERLGLLDFWRTSGRWPDFCKTEPESVCAALRSGATPKGLRQ